MSHFYANMTLSERLRARGRTLEIALSVSVAAHPTLTLLLKSEIGFLFAPKCVCCLTHLRDAKRLREKN
jgi:hypothetical protein